MRIYGVIFYLVFTLGGCSSEEKAIAPEIQQMEVARPFNISDSRRYDAIILVSYELSSSSNTPVERQNYWVRNWISDAYRQALHHLTIDELASMNRAAVSQAIQESASNQAAGLGIRFVDLSIKSITPTASLLERLASNYQHAASEKDKAQQLLNTTASLRDFLVNTINCQIPPSNEQSLASDQYQKDIETLSAKLNKENKRLNQLNEELELLMQEPDSPTRVSAVEEKQYLISKHAQQRDEIRRDYDRESGVLSAVLQKIESCTAPTKLQSSNTLVITDKVNKLKSEEQELKDQLAYYARQMVLAKKMTIDADF